MSLSVLLISFLFLLSYLACLAYRQTIFSSRRYLTNSLLPPSEVPSNGSSDPDAAINVDVSVVPAVVELRQLNMIEDRMYAPNFFVFFIPFYLSYVIYIAYCVRIFFLFFFFLLLAASEILFFAHSPDIELVASDRAQPLVTQPPIYQM